MTIDTSSMSVPGFDRNSSLNPLRSPACAIIVDKKPPTAYTAQRNTGYPPDLSYTTVPNPALFQGQVCIYHDELTLSYPFLFVVVNIGGTLTWKSVIFSGRIIDVNTGAYPDPLSAFYNPLSR